VNGEIWDPLKEKNCTGKGGTEFYLMFRSYRDGSRKMTTIQVNSMPPLPPFVAVDIRQRIVPKVNRRFL